MTPQDLRTMADTLDDTPCSERQARLTMEMAADALRKAANEIERLSNLVQAHIDDNQGEVKQGEPKAND